MAMRRIHPSARWVDPQAEAGVVRRIAEQVARARESPLPGMRSESPNGRLSG
jgi:hypothetical protein